MVSVFTRTSSPFCTNFGVAMHPYETASDSFIGDDQYHLRRAPSLFTLFFQNKRHKHKVFFPRIFDAVTISICTEGHISDF